MLSFLSTCLHQSPELVKDDEPAARDPSWPIRAALQKRMWFLWQHCLAGPVLKVLAWGKSARKAKTDPRRLGTCWKVSMVVFVQLFNSSKKKTLSYPFLILACSYVHLYIWSALQSYCFTQLRLQREEEEAYANRQQKTQSQPTITPFSKFEERKTKEKSSKVNTVTKFFTPSTKTPPKKGVYCCNHISAKMFVWTQHSYCHIRDKNPALPVLTC